VRRKRKARHALSTKPVPDPLPGGALVGEVPGHDRKWSSRVLVTVKDAICFMKNLGEILASQTLHPSIEKPMLDGQAEPPPDRNPSCVAAEESGRRLARAALESMDAIKPDAVVGLSVAERPASLIGALNSPHDKSADKRQSLKTKPISRGTERSYGAGGEEWQLRRCI
jgi:hypothetical protein